MDIKSESMGFGVSQVSFSSGPETKITFCLYINIATNSSWESFVGPSYAQKSRGGWTIGRSEAISASENAMLTVARSVAEEARETASLIFRRKNIKSTTSTSIIASESNLGSVAVHAVIHIEHRAKSEKLIEAFQSAVKTIAESRQGAVRNAMIDALVDRDAIIRDAEVQSMITSTVEEILKKEREVSEDIVDAKGRRGAARLAYLAELASIDRMVAGEIMSRRSETVQAVLDEKGNELESDVGAEGIEKIRGRVFDTTIEVRSHSPLFE